MQSSFLIDLCKLCGLGVLAGLLGIASNAMRHPPIPWSYLPKDARMAAAVTSISGSPRLPTTDHSEAIEKIKLAQVVDAVREKRASVVDARPSLFYRMGHLPGAINIPREQFQTDYLKHPELARDKQRPVIIYCQTVSCEDSTWVAKGLQALGHRKVTIFAEGWDAWQAAGQRMETGP